MNPVAQQLAKGGPFAPTSWGAFGPGWLWVSSAEEAGQNITVGRATEVETANPITPFIDREVVLGQVVERELANPITPLLSREVVLGRAVEAEIARAITPEIAMPIFVTLGTATERELARGIRPETGAQLGEAICATLMATGTCDHISVGAACVILRPTATASIDDL